MSLIALLLVNNPLMAQDEVDAVRPFHGVGGPGSRAEGLGQAFTAVADNGTAIFYNPAGLAHITSLEIGIGLSHLNTVTEASDGSEDNRGSLSITRLSDFTIVYPMNNSKWTLGAAINTVRAYESIRQLHRVLNDSTIRTQNITVDGRLQGWSLGIGYQFSHRLALGGALEASFGGNTYRETEVERQGLSTTYTATNNIEPQYRGLSARLGLLFAPGSYWRVGLMVQSPLSIVVRETSFSEVDPSPETRDYTTTQSYSIRLGTALNFGPLILSGDLFWQDFSQTRFKSEITYDDFDLDSNLVKIPIDPEINLALRNNYRSVAGVAFGAELLMPGADLKIRGGYRNRPQITGGESAQSGHQTFSLGASLLVAPGMKLDLAYALTQWERNLPAASFYWRDDRNPLRTASGSFTANISMRL